MSGQTVHPAMKRVVLPLLSLALGAVVVSAARNHTPIARAVHSSGPPTSGRHMDVASGTVARALSIVAPVLVPNEDDRAEVRRKVRDAEANTYISDILHARDSSL